MVRIHLGPPHTSAFGALAQLGERLLCKHQVIGSIPIGSTISQSKRRGSKAAAHYDKNGQRREARPQGAASLRLTGSRVTHHQHNLEMKRNGSPCESTVIDGHARRI